MPNSYENTIMPENNIEPIKPDVIPVDDKGQPLPDPTENLSNYLAPKGVEELRKSYSELEVDEDVRNTMEPPQKTGLLRKHRAGKRGYGYYGYGATQGNIPNDSNGLKPSPLSELFSEAEALEPDFNLEKIRDHVMQNHENIGELGVVETPKLDSSAIKNPVSSDKKSDGDILKKPEVIKDPNAPKFLDMYKESTNTRVVYQSDVSEVSNAQTSKFAEDAKEIFSEHSQVTKAKKKLSRKEEKKAIKAAIKAEKKKAKERRKAEKAARKAAKKAAKRGTPIVTAPEDIIGIIGDNIKKSEDEKKQNLNTGAKDVSVKKDDKEIKTAEENAKNAKAEAQKAVAEKAEAEKQLEIANRQKEEAKLEAQRAAQEAEKKLREEKDALLKQQQETKAAQEEKAQALLKLDEEKAAALQAAEDAKNAREEAERLKAELEAMKEAAAQALAQKQEAEEAARIAREEKEKLNEEIKAREEQRKEAEKAEKAPSQQKNTADNSAEADDGADDIGKAIAKAKAEREAIEKEKSEAAESKESAEAEEPAEKLNDVSSTEKRATGDVYMNSPTMEVIKRRIAEMEAQLSSNDSRKK